jgi:peptidoglycan hydrolase-like protein with peptidoglycan-binding domain
MIKTISFSKLSNNLGATAGMAVVLALTMMVGFQYAEASINVTTTENLTIGSKGAEVAALQGIMSELGFLQIPAGTPMGYFGALTRSAIAKYQTSRGVSPAVGYFGPLTKVALHQDLDSRGMTLSMGW